MVKQRKQIEQDIFVALGLFLVAIIPRLWALSKFITADEPRWVVRSLAFLEGFLAGNWAQTLQTGHPGVTTMWGGSFGAVLYYVLFYPAANLTTFLSSLSHNYQRIDSFIFPWMRLSMVIMTSIGVVFLFWLLKKDDRQLAIIAALLFSFHPLYLAHSQILHHDAPVAVFLMLGVLTWLRYLSRFEWKWAVFSGVATGLALLSKSTAYALFPFMIITWILEVWPRRGELRQAIAGGILGGTAAITIIVMLWPALWVIPGEVFKALFSWVADSADVQAVSNTLLPSRTDTLPWLGIFFYPINWLLKTTPLMLLGFAFLPRWWKNHSSTDPLKRMFGYLLLWVIIFTVMLTVGDKRDGRYLLPIYFALSILAAAGIQSAWSFFDTRWLSCSSHRASLCTVVFWGLLLATSITYYPYYLSYYNPLVGGPLTATKLVRVGWGDGMETAAHWLNAQPDSEHLKVATILEQSFWLWFNGEVVSPQTDKIFSADYVLNYHRQIQNKVPFDEYFVYYAARTPEFKLRHAGIDYLSLYHLPPLASLGRISVDDSELILRAYTLNAPLIAPSETFTATLVWRHVQNSEQKIEVQLRDKEGKVWGTSAPAPVVDPKGPSAVEGHYTISLPAEIPRGTEYTLWVKPVEAQKWVKFAPLSVGYSRPPQYPPVSMEFSFGDEIALRGFQIDNSVVEPGQTINLKLWWQAYHRMSNSYTFFVHVVDSSGAKIAQQDLLPGNGAFPTNTWQPNEWLIDTVPLTISSNAAPGKYMLLLGWYNVKTGERLPVIGDQTGENAVTLADVTVK